VSLDIEYFVFVYKIRVNVNFFHHSYDLLALLSPALFPFVLSQSIVCQVHQMTCLIAEENCLTEASEAYV
jgi:hypothetical protein